jgi:hypothetical protein
MDASNQQSFSVDRWLALLTVVFLTHMAEEMWVGGGLPAYDQRTLGVHIDATRFVLVNVVGAALIVLGAWLARKFRLQTLAIVILSTFALTNGVRHTLTSVRTAAYNPGVATSLALFLPLGTLALVGVRRLMNGALYLLVIGLGIGVQVGVTVMTLRGWKF